MADKTGRLFAIIDSLRRRRRPVTAEIWADEHGVSVRTLYRDIQALIALGAPIEGEAGVGYVLRPGFFLPPDSCLSNRCQHSRVMSTIHSH